MVEEAKLREQKPRKAHFEKLNTKLFQSFNFCLTFEQSILYPVVFYTKEGGLKKNKKKSSRKKQTLKH